MKMAVSFIVLLILGFTLYLVENRAIGRTMNSKIVAHSFGFDASEATGDPSVKILNFQYGDSKAVGTFVEDDWLAAGRVAQGGRVFGGMPVGYFLYVKWSVRATGVVHEERVDLKGLLPSDMDHKVVYFTFRGEQLAVYVIDGNTKAQLHAPGAPACPVWSYGDFRCTRIYPDRWSNF